MTDQRIAAITELYETEKTYVQGLQTLCSVFSDPIRLAPKALLLRRTPKNDIASSSQRLLTNEEITKIFSNIDTLLPFHQEMLTALEETISNEKYAIGTLMLTRAPFFRMYSQYLNNYSFALATLKTCEEQDPDFKTFLDTSHKDPRMNGLNIVAFLLLPVQRIPRYKLLLEVIYKHTTQYDPDYKNLTQALQSVTEITEQVNEKIRAAESAHKVVELQMSLSHSYKETLIEPTRRFIYSGNLIKISRRAIQKRTFFLFNDMILYARETSGKKNATLPDATYQYKGKEVLSSSTWVRDLSDSMVLKNAFQIVGSNKTYTVFASNEREKKLWMNNIESVISELTMKALESETKKNEIKIPVVSTFYKYFTLPLDEILQESEKTQNDDGNGNGNEEETKRMTTLQRKISSWKILSRSSSVTKDKPQTPLLRFNSAPPSLSEENLSTSPNGTQYQIQNNSFSLLDNLLMPPKPPEELDGFLRRTSGSRRKFSPGSEGKSSNSTHINSKDGLPYRLKPLPVPPQKNQRKMSKALSIHRQLVNKNPYDGDTQKIDLNSNPEQTQEEDQIQDEESSLDEQFEPTFLARAVWNSDAQEEEELSFVSGDIITIIDSEDDEWWFGELNGIEGFLPAAFVTRLDDETMKEKIVEAMWSYDATHPEELSFQQGDLIRILWDGDLYWCEGESLKTKAIGWFPANLVAWDEDDDEDED